MKFRISEVGCAVACLALAGCTPQPDALDVDEIVARHVAASGGEQAFDGLNNVRIRPEIVEPTFTVEGDYRASRQGQMRIDIYADGARVFSEGIDDQGPWQQPGEGMSLEEMSEAGREALASGIDKNIFGLHDLETRGHEIALHGREEIDGINYYVLHLVPSVGEESYLFVNPRNWMIDRARATYALHPDMDPEEHLTEEIFSDFRELCGVMRPAASRTIDMESGEEIQRTRWLDADCNLEDDELGLGRPQPVPAT